MFTIDSADDGATWGDIVNITDVANSGDWGFVGTGPPGGIQLASGRIVIGISIVVVPLQFGIVINLSLEK